MKTKNNIRSRFVCVHNDTFWRCFKTCEEILEYCLQTNEKNIDIKFEIIPVSKNEYGINVFLLDIFYKESIEWLDEFAQETELFGLSNLDDVRYYLCTPCEFNIIE
jgi:hypothetical protein